MSSVSSGRFGSDQTVGPVVCKVQCVHKGGGRFSDKREPLCLFVEIRPDNVSQLNLVAGNQVG